MPKFDAITIEAKFDGTNWTDISSDIVGGFEGDYGLFGNTPFDRVGSPGTLKFALDNSQYNSAGLLGYYSPGHANCRSGFTGGLEVRVTFTLDGRKKTKWTGRVLVEDGIEIIPGKYGEKKTVVTAKDWMEQAASEEINGIAYATDKTIMQGVALLLAEMTIQPHGTTDYRTGDSTFNTLFDTTRQSTTAMAEFGKMAQSEQGYIYLTRNGLRVEGRNTRNSEKTDLDEYPKSRDLLDTLINESDETIVNEAGDIIVISEATEAIFSDTQIKLSISTGKNFYNNARFRAYPREVDAAATTILYSLKSPMFLEAGASAVITGSYSDPSSKATRVSGIEMVTPVATTHYQMYANSDGTGTDLTANLTVTPSFGTGGFKHTVENTGATDGYITKFEAVGKGVYIYDPVEYYVEDADSITANGKTNCLVVDMKYQDDPIVSNRWADIAILQHKTIRTNAEEMTMVANKSAEYLSAFLYLEPGDRVRVAETVSGVYSDYYIHKVAFSVGYGGIVTFTWLLRQSALDVFKFTEWDGEGTWDDLIYGWDF